MERREQARRAFRRKMRRRRFITYMVILTAVMGFLYAKGYIGRRNKDLIAVSHMESQAIVRIEEKERKNTVPEEMPAVYEEVSLSILEKELTAESALIMRGDTLLYERKAGEKMYPASMTKLLTALVALQYGDPQEIVTIPDMTGASCYSEGSMLAYFQEGDQIRLLDLIGVMMVYSANDAASAIAIHVGGSEEEYARMMNAYAIELGAMRTHFMNPNGLHHEEHYTCAKDMMLILKAAVENETLLSIMQTAEYSCEWIRNGSRIAYSYPTTSRYLNGTYSIDGFEYVAGKTGYTGPAGRCFASCFEYIDEKYYCVVMKSADYVSATTLLYYYVSDPTRMWDVIE